MKKLNFSNLLILQSCLMIKIKQKNNYLAFIFGFLNFNHLNICSVIQRHPLYNKAKSHNLKSNLALGVIQL